MEFWHRLPFVFFLLFLSCLFWPIFSPEKNLIFIKIKILRPFQSNMVEEEVAKVDGKETGGSNEEGLPQPKQLVQQQCHHGASLDIP